MEDATILANEQDKVENEKADNKADGDKKEAFKMVKDEDVKIESEMSHPQVKLDIKNNTTDKIKPAEVSDSENIEDNELPKEGDKDQASKDKAEDKVE